LVRDPKLAHLNWLDVDHCGTPRGTLCVTAHFSGGSQTTNAMFKVSLATSGRRFDQRAFAVPSASIEAHSVVY
jgi:hypothetical protein